MGQNLLKKVPLCMCCIVWFYGTKLRDLQIKFDYTSGFVKRSLFSLHLGNNNIFHDLYLIQPPHSSGINQTSHIPIVKSMTFFFSASILNIYCKLKLQARTKQRVWTSLTLVMKYINKLTLSLPTVLSIAFAIHRTEYIVISKNMN